jgi:hypothetical protein
MTSHAKCPYCGGSKLSPDTKLQSSSYDSFLRFHAKDGSWLGKTQDAELRARVCLDCGHAHIFVDEQSLTWLQAHFG